MNRKILQDLIIWDAWRSLCATHRVLPLVWVNGHGTAFVDVGRGQHVVAEGIAQEDREPEIRRQLWSLACTIGARVAGNRPLSWVENINNGVVKQGVLVDDEQNPIIVPLNLSAWLPNAWRHVLDWHFYEDGEQPLTLRGLMYAAKPYTKFKPKGLADLLYRVEP